MNGSRGPANIMVVARPRRKKKGKRGKWCFGFYRFAATRRREEELRGNSNRVVEPRLVVQRFGRVCGLVVSRGLIIRPSKEVGNFVRYQTGQVSSVERSGRFIEHSDPYSFACIIRGRTRWQRLANLSNCTLRWNLLRVFRVASDLPTFVPSISEPFHPCRVRERA